ncbi:MAG: hypothetical protein HQ581_23290 [Planctomycetes bacterium]|nr:hypothetical protein [Planctomycetota bacterium]
MEGLLERIAKATGMAGGYLIRYPAIAIGVLIVLLVLSKLLRRKRATVKGVTDLAIDVMALGNAPPPPGPPVLEFFNTPVRLAAVVLATAGRVRELPPLDQWDDLFDAIVPGLAAVVKTHRPLVRRWPAQMSTRGFAHTFFGHARLPGEGGKGTPWSSAAGLFKIEGQPIMAGLVLRTESTSSHAQEIVETEEQWLSMLRVK